MSDIPRVVFPDYKRKLPVAMTQKGKRPSIGARGFFGTHELPGADCPIQKAAPRRPSGYVTTIGTEPQVAPFSAAITRNRTAGIVNLAARGMLVLSVARWLGSEGPLLAYCASRSNGAGPQ